MHYDERYGQWLLDATDMSLLGKIKEALILDGTHLLRAGTVMVCCFNKDKAPVIMFQLLESIDLFSIKSNTLIGIEPGSVVNFTASKITPATIFRNCRLPTEYEFKLYERSSTV